MNPVIPEEPQVNSTQNNFAARFTPEEEQLDLYKPVEPQNNIMEQQAQEIAALKQENYELRNSTTELNKTVESLSAEKKELYNYAIELGNAIRGLQKQHEKFMERLNSTEQTLDSNSDQLEYLASDISTDAGLVQRYLSSNPDMETKSFHDGVRSLATSLNLPPSFRLSNKRIGILMRKAGYIRQSNGRSNSFDYIPAQQ